MRDSGWIRIAGALALLLGIILSIVQVTVGLGTIWDRIRDSFPTVQVVKLAFTPHGVSHDPQVLVKRYKQEFIDSANAHSAIKGKYRIEPSVEGETYDGVFDALLNDDVLLGFMSPYNYVLYIHGKKPQYPANAFPIVGVKRYRNEEFYSSWFVVNDSCRWVSRLSDISMANFSSGRIQLILSSITVSTSTYRIPMVYLSEQGIVLDTNQRNFEKVDRWDMLDRVRRGTADKCVVGVMSDQDWNVLEPKDTVGVKHFAIPIPIPFDVLLAHRIKWQGLPDEQRKALIAALASTTSAAKASSWEYSQFEERLGSGVVVSRHAGSMPNEWDVILPDEPFDIYDLLGKLQRTEMRVAVFRQDIGVSQSGAYAVSRVPIGSGTLRIQVLNRAILSSPTAIDLLGAHVLPQ